MTVAAKVDEPRRRNAESSREQLMRAAGELFAERGYERTTIRDIGQLAGVDPTLIARYFGGKAALYLAVLRGDSATDPIAVNDPGRIERLLDRVDLNGPTPTLYAAVHPHADAELQAAAIAILQQRLVIPSAQVADAHGLDNVQLRSEIVIAALAGIVLSRSAQTFETLGTAPSADVAPLVAELLASLLEN